MIQNVSTNRRTFGRESAQADFVTFQPRFQPPTQSRR
jgi:hypothetical protein